MHMDSWMWVIAVIIVIEELGRIRRALEKK